MREIKFRGYDHENKKWVYGHLTKLVEGIRKFWAIIEDKDDELTRYYIHDEKSIGEWTGLKDKNGKEIYELMEIDNQYRVVYEGCSYVLQDISTGDIIGLLDHSARKADEREITREYSPMAEN